MIRIEKRVKYTAEQLEELEKKGEKPDRDASHSDAGVNYKPKNSEEELEERVEEEKYEDKASFPDAPETPQKQRKRK